MWIAQTLGSMPFKTPSAESYKHLQQDETFEKLYSRVLSNPPIHQTTTHNTVFQ
jgi:16S rRNA G1207 methylase RsmC